jgi:hypothetical protein
MSDPAKGPEITPGLPVPPEPRLGWRSRVDAVPPWIQAFTAVLAVVLAAVGIWVGIDQKAQDGATGTVPAAPYQAPIATIRGFVIGPDSFTLSGDYQHLQPARETLYIVARPTEDALADWVPVEAQLTSVASSMAGYEDGTWTARVPAPPPTRWTVAPAILPGSGSALGLTDGLDGLRQFGASAPGVIARGAEVIVTK